jgi:hypothetical protein
MLYEDQKPFRSSLHFLYQSLAEEISNCIKPDLSSSIELMNNANSNSDHIVTLITIADKDIILSQQLIAFPLAEKGATLNMLKDVISRSVSMSLLNNPKVHHVQSKFTQ